MNAWERGFWPDPGPAGKILSPFFSNFPVLTRRRVYQLWKQYRETGIIPVIGKAMGRPKKPVTAEESGEGD
jgi:hypothetical protein